MSTSYEYDYKLYYHPAHPPDILICEAPSIEELKVAARKDSEENMRAPERYTYKYTTSGTLFNNEEIRQVSVYNELRELSRGDE